MLEVLEFLFSDFWHWLGGLLYLAVIVAAIGCVGVKQINNYDAKSKKEEK